MVCFFLTFYKLNYLVVNRLLYLCNNTKSIVFLLLLFIYFCYFLKVLFKSFKSRILIINVGICNKYIS